MPSSRPDRLAAAPNERGTERADAEQSLRQVCENYESALDALRQGDLEAVTDALRDSEELLATPTSIEPGVDLGALHKRATTAHHRLISTLNALQTQTGEDLAHARRGRRALRSYMGEGQQPGQRLRSRA